MLFATIFQHGYIEWTWLCDRVVQWLYGFQHGGLRTSWTASNWHSEEKTQAIFFTLLYVLLAYFIYFYSLVSPLTSPLCFANLVLLILPPHLPFQYFAIFLFLSPCLPLFYTLFSSSSSAAECCPSYLCSRLGMFFLIMRSILSLPFHHLLFSVWAACVSCLSPPTHLGLLLSFHWGWEWVGGRAVPWLAKEQHWEGILECLMLYGWGTRPSLCPLKTTAGRWWVELLLCNGEILVFRKHKGKKKSLGAYRVAERRSVCFLSAALFWVHIEVAPAWLNASQGASRLRAMHDNPVSPQRCACAGPHHDVMMPSIHPFLCLHLCVISSASLLF